MDYVREELLRQRQTLALLMRGGDREEDAQDRRPGEGEGRQAASERRPGEKAGKQAGSALWTEPWDEMAVGGRLSVSQAGRLEGDRQASVLAAAMGGRAAREEFPAEPAPLPESAEEAEPPGLFPVEPVLLPEGAESVKRSGALPRRWEAGGTRRRGGGTVSAPAGTRRRSGVGAPGARASGETEDETSGLFWQVGRTGPIGGGVDLQAVSRAVSRAVERDARRYDGGFTIY